MKCTKCRVYKPDNQFRKNKVKPGGIHTVCKDCVRDREQARISIVKCTDPIDLLLKTSFIYP